MKIVIFRGADGRLITMRLAPRVRRSARLVKDCRSFYGDRYGVWE